MNIVCLKASLEENIHNGELSSGDSLQYSNQENQRKETKPSTKVVSTDELALLAKLEEANRLLLKRILYCFSINLFRTGKMVILVDVYLHRKSLFMKF